MEEKASAVTKAEEGAADLKKRACELSQNLEENEKDYQVYVLFCALYSVDIGIVFRILDMRLHLVFDFVKLLAGCIGWQKQWK